jgi:hypothetical protein
MEKLRLVDPDFDEGDLQRLFEQVFTDWILANTGLQPDQVAAVMTEILSTGADDAHGHDASAVGSRGDGSTRETRRDDSAPNPARAAAVERVSSVLTMLSELEWELATTELNAKLSESRFLAVVLPVAGVVADALRALRTGGAALAVLAFFGAWLGIVTLLWTASPGARGRGWASRPLDSVTSSTSRSVLPSVDPQQVLSHGVASRGCSRSGRCFLAPHSLVRI